MDAFYAKLFWEALLKEEAEGKLKLLAPTYNGKKLFHDYNAFKDWLEATGLIVRPEKNA